MPLSVDRLSDPKGKPTRLERRNASSGGPAKYEWLITQNYGKDEVKLTGAQMQEIASIVNSNLDNYTCGCPSAEWIRYNPTTKRGILMCMAHADLHDQGHGFEVTNERL